MVLISETLGKQVQTTSPMLLSVISQFN